MTDKRRLTVGLVQMRTGIDRRRSVDEAIHLIRQAASRGARLIVTPEMTNVLDRDKARLFAHLDEEAALEEIGRFHDLATDLGVTLAIGSMAVLLPGDPPKIANRAYVFGAGGRWVTYDKIHLFDVDLPTGESWRESRTMVAGQTAGLVEAAGTRIGLSICYDLRFPHLYRALARAGAEILTVPAAFTVPTGKAHWEVLLRARAIENAAYVLAPAQGGRHEDGRATWGHSTVVAPTGEVLATLDHDEPGVVVADLDLDLVNETRMRIPSLTLEHDIPVRISDL
ncbi:nitrilase 1-like protein [Parvularcula bermudensis HTCC2503]|uniref:Nitrilase 1-like protein n=1 Tax=Parvularcula bermudensis (strain ATCC BAA-594 / HTCC2503 / KCTC 12087) TaxID=314260 RepID=E0TG45_PARBH|nr:carbon-nitrogen hydrolase family protein [Parvularcula bermudensis]ADM10616.1 nitrilase 1-like protein [Parvularcula bermudensis HTCC2503]